jgi:long-chain acyl-CoA synthetase
MSEPTLPAGWPAMSIQQAHAMLTQPGSPLETEVLDIRGVKTPVWKNAPPTLRAVVETARGHGEKIFLVYEDERVSYEAFFRATARLAQVMAEQGVMKGDRSGSWPFMRRPRSARS